MIGSGWPLLVCAALCGDLLEGEGPPVVLSPITAVASPSPRPAMSASQAAALSQAVTDALAGKRLPAVAGLSMGVLFKGHQWRESRGVVDNDGHPASSTTPYRMASITKTMTAVAAMQLVEEGRLNLDEPISTYLGTVPKSWSKITLRHLLSHTSGIRHYPRRGPERRLNRYLSSDDTLGMIKARKLASPPGQGFLYTTYGYDVIGSIIERVEARRFADTLHDRVFDPLGMRATFFEPSQQRDPRWPRGLRLSRRGVTVSSTPIDLSSRYAGGGIRSNVDDMLTYAEALLGGHLVDSSSMLAMTTPIVSADGGVADYGLGFAVYPQRGHLVVAHAGGQPETTTLLYLVPDQGLAVVLATNLEGQGDVLGGIAAAVTETLLEGGVPRRDIATTDAKDGVLAFALNRAFTHGRAFVDHVVVDDAAVAVAVDRFAALALRSSALVDGAANNADAAKKRIKEAHHPRAGRITPIVGAMVARALRDADAATFDAWPERGPLAFFAAYVALCEARPERCAHPLPDALSARITALNDAFVAASPDEVRRLRRHELSDVDRTVALLQPLLGARVHLDFDGDLQVTAHRLLASRPGDAVRLSRLNARLHPRSPLAELGLAEACLVVDDEESAALALEAAWRAGGPSLTPTLLMKRAARLRHLKHPRGDAAADAVLAFARKHHPTDATLALTADDDDGGD